MSPATASARCVSADGFLRAVRVEAEGAGVIVQADFDAASFDAGLFDRLGISRPPALHAANGTRLAAFLAGRAVARIAQVSLGLAPCVIPIGPDRAPVWPAGLVGSISHARTRVACLLRPRSAGQPMGGVGIDIEMIATGDALRTIFDRVLTPFERALIASATDVREATEAARLATLVFAAKEALFKALYPRLGYYFGFDCAELARLPDDGLLALAVCNCLRPALPDDGPLILRHVTEDGHVLVWTPDRRS